MTEDRGPRTEQTRQSAKGVPVIGRSFFAVRSPSVVVIALVPLLLAAGCRNRALEQAQQEARENKAAVARLNGSVAMAAKEIATLKEELSSVRQSRDGLEKQVEQLKRERDQTATFAQQAQEAISGLTVRESGQRSVVAALEKQLAEQKILVEDQRKLIEQLQKGAAGQPVTATAQAADKPPTADPNEKP